MLPEISTLLHWVSVYGYPSLGVLLLLAAAGVPIPIELVLLAFGGLSAAGGGPGFLALAALGIAATVAGDALDYGIGRLVRKQSATRLSGRRILGRRWRMPESAGFMRRAEGLRSLARWGSSGIMIFLSRCVLTPLEAPLSLLAGATPMPFARFLLWDALGEAVYVLAYLALGYTGAASLATSGPALAIAGGAIVLATLGPLVVVRVVTRRQQRAHVAQCIGERGFTTEDTEGHRGGERRNHEGHEVHEETRRGFSAEGAEEEARERGRGDGERRREGGCASERTEAHAA